VVASPRSRICSAVPPRAVVELGVDERQQLVDRDLQPSRLQPQLIGAILAEAGLDRRQQQGQGPTLPPWSNRFRSSERS
jgi:hypothetical protein